MLQEILYQHEFSFYLRLIGVVGFVIYMLSFASLQMGWMNSDKISFTLANMIAASMVLLSLSVEWNLPSAMIQIAWIGIGLIGLLRRWRRKAINIAFSRAAQHKANV